MIRFKQWLAIPLLMAVLVLSGQGQSLPEWLAKNPGKKPPAGGILDESRILGRDTELAKRISTRIRKLESEHGYKLYVVVEPVLIGTSAQEQATDLRRNWLPDGDGLVIVFESDSRTLGIGQDMVGNPDQTENPHRVPSYETTAIINRALGAVDGKLGPEGYLEAVVDKLAGEFDGYFVRREAPPPPERSVRIVLVVVGGLALLGLGLIGAGALVRHSSMARVRTFRFPVVDRPERLGAPCGADVTARRFARPVPRQQA
ncbi:MAG: TPM domain-containing protein [Luteolibacter sp.]|uniref:TPM domain-containing protein n=1 Tax=Luteolibacter sp. TaxID=1962973 RepID=UPI0032648581